VGFMSSGPIVAMELVAEDAVAKWRKLVGPTNSTTAKAEAPNSIRAHFGTDGTMNAVHGSDSDDNADLVRHPSLPPRRMPPPPPSKMLVGGWS
jgi:nucleoside diphosphate kinase